MQWDIDQIDAYEWEYELGPHEFFGMRSNRLVTREPIGVVGLITPWNFPFMLNLSKLAPALAAGCTVVLKPAPDTPYSATWIGKLVAEETDIPPGVVNVVTSVDPAAVGEVLTDDERVDMISFTGSTAVGKRIAARGADTLKRVFLELGGKSANIILDDADFPAAIGVRGHGVHALRAGLRDHDAACCCRVRATTKASSSPRPSFESFPYGDPTDLNNMAGPLINARQRERVLGYIEKGKAEGAKCIVGGGPATQFDKGYFVQPTLFVDVDPNATIAREEIFGPVLVDHPVRGRRRRGAHRQRLALRPVGRGRRASRSTARWASPAGSAPAPSSVNGGLWFGPDSPFGGYKESGLGREHGVQGFEEYLETKTIGLPPDLARTALPNWRQTIVAPSAGTDLRRQFASMLTVAHREDLLDELVAAGPQVADAGDERPVARGHDLVAPAVVALRSGTRRGVPASTGTRRRPSIAGSPASARATNRPLRS